MKSQIFAAIALLIAGMYTVQVNETKLPHVKAKEVKVVTTNELIKHSSLNQIAKKIEARQDSVENMIKEVVKDDIIDSIIVPKDSIIVEK